MQQVERMLKEREQTPPRRMSIGGRKVLVTGPHRQICQSNLTDRHHLVLPMIQLIHGSLFGFEIFQRPEHVSLLFTVAFLFTELAVTVLPGTNLALGTAHHCDFCTLCAIAPVVCWLVLLVCLHFAPIASSDLNVALVLQRDFTSAIPATGQGVACDGSNRQRTCVAADKRSDPTPQADRARAAAAPPARASAPARR